MFLNDAYILSQIASRFRLLAFFLRKNLKPGKAIQQRSAWMHCMQCMHAVHACSSCVRCMRAAQRARAALPQRVLLMWFECTLPFQRTTHDAHACTAFMHCMHALHACNASMHYAAESLSRASDFL